MPIICSEDAAMRYAAFIRSLLVSLCLVSAIMGAASPAAAQSGAALPPAPALASAHALIITIGRYQGGVPALLGVRFDAAKATRIAQSMGVAAENIHYLADEAATLEGIDRALTQLYERINPGDQVFLYYSGHGARVLVSDPVNRCAEALVSIDGQPYLDSRLDEHLKRLADTSGKIIAFIDACHSGGVTVRSVAAASAPRPKAWTKGEAEACARPVNVITRSLNQPRQVGGGKDNYVYIAASRDNEVAFDLPSKGGIATSAWTECIAGAAVDSDGSGALSAREIQACAQAKIDLEVRNASGVLPHHVTVIGNADAVLAFPREAAPPAAAPPAAALAPVTPVAPVTQLPVAPVAAAPVAPVAVPVAAPAPIRPAATLADLYSNRDDRRTVKADVATPRMTIGRDKLALTVTSSHAGHLYILMAGSDGKSFDLLFPNQIDRQNRIDAGVPLSLPRASWELVAQGPPGTNRLLLLVSDAPRDFKTLPLQASGPFSVLEPSPLNARDIQLVFAGSKPGDAECQDKSSLRTLAVARRCSTAYGAALLDVAEVP
jgi:hypothetical protein